MNPTPQASTTAVIRKKQFNANASSLRYIIAKQSIFCIGKYRKCSLQR